MAIVGSSLPGNAPAVTAQSCNYYTGVSVTGQKVNLDTCSISKSSDSGTNFVYYLGDKKLASKANCSERTWTTLSNKQVNTPQSQATKKMLDRVCNEQISSNSGAEEITESTSGERSIAQSSSTVYEDDNIRARATGASFDRSNFAQVSLILENKSGKDLFLAAETRASRVISDSGETSECQVSGIKDGYWVSTTEPKPLQFSRIKSKAKVSVSVSNCQRLTSASKPVSVGVSIPLLMMENEQTTNVTISLTGIPINYKSKK